MKIFRSTKEYFLFLWQNYMPTLFFPAASLFFAGATETIPPFDQKQLICLTNSKCILQPSLYQYGLFFLSIALFIFGTIYLLKHSIKKFRNRNVTGSFNQKIWETELRAFSNNMNLTSNDRVTLYIYLEQTNTFFKVGRESPNLSFKNGGRRTYKSGIIESAFNGTCSAMTIDNDPDRNLTAYYDEVVKKSGMERAAVKKLSMKSRYLYAMKVVRLNNTPVGVLLFETIKENLNHLVDHHNGAYTEDRLKRIFQLECKRLSFYLDEFESPSLLFKFEEGSMHV